MFILQLKHMSGRPNEREIAVESQASALEKRNSFEKNAQISQSSWREKIFRFAVDLPPPKSLQLPEAFAEIVASVVAEEGLGGVWLLFLKCDV